MSPEAALEKQIEIYRRMTGEERLAWAMRLRELAWNVGRSGIRDQFPTATEEQVEQKLRERLALGGRDEVFEEIVSGRFSPKLT